MQKTTLGLVEPSPWLYLFHVLCFHLEARVVLSLVRCVRLGKEEEGALSTVPLWAGSH